jgi:bla regulator protein blaR1
MNTSADVALAISQSSELAILAKATAILVLGLIASRLTVRARASVRHLVLSATFGSLALMPLVALLAPAIIIEVPIARQTIAPPTSVQPGTPRVMPGEDHNAPAPPAPIAWRSVARIGIGAGVVLFAVPLGVMSWRLRRIHRTGLPSESLSSLARSIARESGMAQDIQILHHELVPAPVTFGLVHPIVVMPPDTADWHDQDVTRAIVHELEHVRRADWAVHTMARAVCALYWFHPLVWIAWRQLGLEAERACDDAVVLKSESTDYAQQLVSLAHRLSSTEAHPMLGMANRSDLSARVTALLDEHQARGRAGVATVAAALAAAVFIVITVAPVRAVAVTAPAVTGVDAPASDGQRQPRRSRALDRALFEAAQEGDLEAVNELINDGANVNAAIEGDGSPLIGAAQSEDIEIVKRLLDAGADPNLAVPGDGCPLIHAAARGQTAMVTLLLDRGADVNQIVEGDENALMNAAEQGALPVVQLLVKRGADVNARIWSGRAGRDGHGEWRTAVSQAQKNGHTAVVSFLMSAGARE